MNTTAVFHEKKTIAVVGGGLASLVLVRQLRNQLIASTDPVEILVIDPAPLDNSVEVALTPFPGNQINRSELAAMPNYLTVPQAA